MRIIAGSRKGHSLVAPKGLQTRPTADRVRESIFNILGVPSNQARVLDLFAGTGALGLEALSRGAAHAVFVESQPAACLALQKNIEKLKVQNHVQIYRRPVETMWPLLQGPFDWIFIDPPYQSGAAQQSVNELSNRSELIAPHGLIIVEHARKPPRGYVDLQEMYGSILVRVDQRHYGQTTVSFYECRAVPSLLGDNDDFASPKNRNLSRDL